MHRLVARKGTALLLEALSGLKDRAWSLDIAGEGEEKPGLQAQANALGLSGRVRFLPPVTEADKPDFLREHDLFVLPSLAPNGDNFLEGLGISLLEAQASGLPVLAARTGGIPEAVREGETGLLFQPGDVGDLEAKLSELLNDRALRERLGREGPAWVAENFSWEKTLKGLEEVLEEAQTK
jgi:phosphatidylinositol alpha-1,6-mannosyltransferase